MPYLALFSGSNILESTKINFHIFFSGMWLPSFSGLPKFHEGLWNRRHQFHVLRFKIESRPCCGNTGPPRGQKPFILLTGRPNPLLTNSCILPCYCLQIYIH